MTFNSTHAAIIAIAVIASIAMVTDTNLAELVPIIAPLGAYAGITQYQRNKNSEGYETKWSGKSATLDEVEIN
jgi:hypothetical protein